MKILLVNPIEKEYTSKNYYALKFPFLVRSPPMVLQQIAALTPEKHTVEMIYERIGEKIDYNKKYDVVGISCNTYNAKESYKIADDFRKQKITVILGGYHPTALPKESKQHADSVVIGEAEKNWPKILKDIQNKKLKPFYRQENHIKGNTIPSANRKINTKYSKKNFIQLIQTSRGCPNNCSFCSRPHLIEGRKIRHRNIDDVIEELKPISKKYIFFIDTSLTIDPEYSKKLFKKMKNLNIKFIAYGNANILNDDEFLKLSKEAGCQAWEIGFDSISQETINYLKKTTNKVDKYKTIIKKIHDLDMFVIGTFVFGFDTDTKDIFEKTGDFIIESDIDCVDLNILTPFPGTPMFKRLESENRILTKNWSKYNGVNIVFKPKNMTVEELKKGMNKVIKKYYSIPYFLKKNVNRNKHAFYSNSQFLLRYFYWRYMFKNKKLYF